MLDIKFIRDNKEIVKEGAKKKHVDIDLNELIKLDDSRLEELKEVEVLLTQINRVSDDIGLTKDQALKIALIEEMRGVKEELKKKEEKLKETIEAWQKIMIQIPNIPSVDTPDGPDESGNVVLRNWGEKQVFDFTPKEHYEIGEKLGIIDNSTAAEVSGARFTYLKGDLVLMQFALINFLMEVLTNQNILENIIKEKNINVKSKPFIPVIPPFMVKPNIYLIYIFSKILKIIKPNTARNKTIPPITPTKTKIFFIVSPVQAKNNNNNITPIIIAAIVCITPL